MDMNIHSDPLVNRDDPIPVVAISAPRDDPSPTEYDRPKGSKRAAIRQSLSSGKLREKFDSFKEQSSSRGHQRSVSSSASESPSKIQDRLMNM
ncbi:Integral peroxisomal membrane peroxin [Lasiodiplodia theobromae]|nr:Integral peroxisomal membrane peroxin [Lasiodiplodia theobromae]KAF4544822.1 Integral peroxisomal membrane peroxin [Lasiodiplodia theobromae]